MTCAVTPVFYAGGGGWRCPVPRINPTETEPVEELATPKCTVAAREGGCSYVRWRGDFGTSVSKARPLATSPRPIVR